MDEIDRRLVEALRANGRETYAELGRKVGLSAPAVHDRIGKLESAGVITGYRASIAPEALGLGVTALIGILPAHGADLDDVAEALRGLTEVEACWFLAGEESFMLKIRVSDNAALEHTIGRLTRIRGVARTRTTVVLSTKWEGRVQAPQWPGNGALGR